jgi:hypothetical protein
MAQLSRFHLKPATESSLRDVVFYIRDRIIHNVQNYDSYIHLKVYLSNTPAIATENLLVS